VIKAGFGPWKIPAGKPAHFSEEKGRRAKGKDPNGGEASPGESTKGESRNRANKDKAGCKTATAIPKEKKKMGFSHPARVNQKKGLATERTLKKGGGF